MQLRDGKLSLSPSDVTAYLACEHLTALSLSRSPTASLTPPLENDQAELIFGKGREHEEAYLKSLRAQRNQVVEIELEPDLDWERAARETVEAMRAGVDVVYQAVFVGDGWRGVADFLQKADTPSDLGPWSYEAVDTKLARHAKPAYILQLCFYSERIAAIQGLDPARIHVLLGNLTQETYKPQEFGAYYRRVCRRLQDFVADPPATEPYPVDHCGICEFKPLCDARWDEVDHLSRVARIQRRQISRLADAGISTLAQLGQAPTEPVPHSIPADSFETLRSQAGLQLRARERGEDEYVILEPQPESGFALLPDHSPGDLFFDFEGNPFWDHEGGLEYLWGILDSGGGFEPIAATCWRAARIFSSLACTFSTGRPLFEGERNGGLTARTDRALIKPSC